MSRDEYSPILATTTPIRYTNYRGGGTGFFLNSQEETYLITNRHVVNPENVSLDGVRIWFRNYPDFRGVYPSDISLRSGEGGAWFGHPDADVDLAVIPLNQKLSTLEDVEKGEPVTGSLAWTQNFYIYPKVDIGDDIVIAGYPGEFVDTSTLFPIVRNASLSTPYSQDFESNPFFVTDARMHPGTSGSPVIMKLESWRAINPEFPEERRHSVYLLGVHSATFYPAELREADEDGVWAEFQNINGDQDDEWKEAMKYELNVAWYPELIDEVLEQI